MRRVFLLLRCTRFYAERYRRAIITFLKMVKYLMPQAAHAFEEKPITPLYPTE